MQNFYATTSSVKRNKVKGTLKNYLSRCIRIEQELKHKCIVFFSDFNILF